MIELILLIFGIVYVFRKFKLAKKSSKDYPNIDPDKFMEWKAAQNKAINIFLLATWGAFIIKLIIIGILSNVRLSSDMAIIINIILIIAWIVGLIIAATFGSKAKELRTAIGIKWP